MECPTCLCENTFAQLDCLCDCHSYGFGERDAYHPLAVADWPSGDDPSVGATDWSCPGEDVHAEVPLRRFPPVQSGHQRVVSSEVRSESRLPDEVEGSIIVDANKRLNGKCFLLTYAQCPEDKSELYDFLLLKGNIERCIIGQEHHEDGNLHLHAYVEYKNKKDVGFKHFDWRGFHPNISMHKKGFSPQKSAENCWKYCCKEDHDPFVFGEPPGDRKRKRNDIFLEARDVARKSSVNEALELIVEGCAYEGIVHYSEIERALHAIRMKFITISPPAKNLSEFRNAPPIPGNWKVLFMHGNTGLGKTAFARALLPEAMVVRHTDQLRFCDFSKGIIFDDYSCSHWPASSIIHLMDWEEPSGINVKHGHVIIPAGTRKIFTFNCNLYGWLPKDIDNAQIEAIERRVTVVNIMSSLF